jgi:hypothetical protein
LLPKFDRDPEIAIPREDDDEQQRGFFDDGDADADGDTDPEAGEADAAPS